MSAKRAQKRMRGRGGFTMIELMVSITALAVVLTMLYGAAATMANLAGTQDSLVMLNQEARQAMNTITRNLRMATTASVVTPDGGGGFAPLTNVPVTQLQYRRVADMDGNGVALNQDMTLGLTQPFLITRDVNDANGDGRTLTQLVRIDQNTGAVVEVLANHVSPVVATGDFYDASNGGVLFRALGGGAIQVTLIMRHQPSPTSPMMVVRLDEVVTPRN